MKVGTDICNVARFLEKIDDEKFIKRIFTKCEQEHILQLGTKQGRAERMTGKFCAKEAVLKLLGTGLDKGIKWTEIEILPDNNGKPNVFLSGTAQKIQQSLHIKNIELSISHTDLQAIAVCVSN